MTKSILCLTFILISVVGLAQVKVYWKSAIQHSTKNFKWANQINGLVSSRYVLLNEDRAYSSYNSIDIDKDGQKEIIVSVSDTTKLGSTDDPFTKIYVFKIKHNRLTILDSSAEYEVDGRGPQIGVHSNELSITHSFHRGYNKLSYLWNNAMGKYLLSSIIYSDIDSYIKRGVHYSKRLTQIYEVSKQTLTIETEEFISETEKEIHSNKKIIHKKLPSTLSLLLKDLKDPSEYDDLLDPDK